MLDADTALQGDTNELKLADARAELLFEELVRVRTELLDTTKLEAIANEPSVLALRDSVTSREVFLDVALDSLKPSREK